MNTTQLIHGSGAYTLSLADSEESIRAAQRLRYEVFNCELGEGLASSELLGLDQDEFDSVCDHLIVTESNTSSVVGTYRLQSGQRAVESGLGYYSSQEFDFTPYEWARPQMLELGRACVASSHRNHAVLALLWRGILTQARTLGCRYLIGCSSLTSRRAECERDSGLGRQDPRAGIECGSHG